ncbi:hypothetical protein AMECASPLE_036594 [Ameca splendens]|uniref:Uncharacterized protein n=1 Tax=Ameca splendens TaxID=208324 RepID=A0ABV0XKQ8_9TELE
MAKNNQKMSSLKHAPGSSSQQDNGNKTIFNKVLPLLKEATNVFDENENLTIQLREINRRIGDTESLKEDYQFLVKQICIYRKINEHLKHQFNDVKIKVEAQASFRDKYRRKQKELENLVQSNKNYEDVVRDLTLKLQDPTVLIENYQRAKDKKENLLQQNKRLVKQVHEVQNQLLKQNQLEKKCEKTEQDNRSSHMKNTVLEKQLDWLEDKLWQKETDFMASYTKTLHIKISKLQQQQRADKCWTDKLKKIRNNWTAINQMNCKLQTEHERLQLELREAKSLKINHSEIHSAVMAIAEENCSLFQDNHRLRKELNDFQIMEDKLETSNDNFQEMSPCPTKTEERECTQTEQSEQTRNVTFPKSFHPVEEREISTSLGGPDADDECIRTEAESDKTQSETDSKSLEEEYRIEGSTDFTFSSKHPVGESGISTSQGEPDADNECVETEVKSVKTQSAVALKSLEVDASSECLVDLSSSPVHPVNETKIFANQGGPSAYNTCDRSEAQISNYRGSWRNMSLYNMFYIIPQTTYNYFLGKR